MAKTKSKKSASKFPWRKVAYATAGVVGGIALITQICLDVRFWHVAQYPSGEPLASMIIQSIRAVDKPAVTEPASKKVYLPDANLVLPPYPQNMPDILYSYTPSVGGSDAEASVTLTNAVSVGISKILNAESLGAQKHDPNTLFTAVPNAQVCARGVHVVFGTRSTYAHLISSKQLADGRTMRIYTEAQSCAYDLQPLANYLGQAQSY